MTKAIRKRRLTKTDQAPKSLARGLHLLITTPLTNKPATDVRVLENPPKNRMWKRFDRKRTPNTSEKRWKTPRFPRRMKMAEPVLQRTPGWSAVSGGRRATHSTIHHGPGVSVAVQLLHDGFGVRFGAVGDGIMAGKQVKRGEIKRRGVAMMTHPNHQAPMNPGVLLGDALRRLCRVHVELQAEGPDEVPEAGSDDPGGHGHCQGYGGLGLVRRCVVGKRHPQTVDGRAADSRQKYSAENDPHADPILDTAALLHAGFHLRCVQVAQNSGFPHFDSVYLRVNPVLKQDL